MLAVAGNSEYTDIDRKFERKVNANKVAKRRAKNKAAKQSRSKNRK